MAFLDTPNLTQTPIANQIVSSEISLPRAIGYLADLEIDCLLVVEEGRLQGWLTTKDVVKLAAEGRSGDDCPLKMVMNQPPCILQLTEAMNMSLALHYLYKYRVNQLPVVNNDGEVCGLVTAQGIMPFCSQEISYIEKLELQIDQFINAQTEQDYFLQEIIESIPGILYIYDVEERRNIYTNKNIATSLGYTSEQIQQMGNKMLSIMIEPEDMPKVLARQKFIETTIYPDHTDEQYWNFDYRVRHADGSCRWLSSQSKPFRRDSDGRITQTIGIAQDITEIKQIEEELRTSQHFLSSMLQAIPGIVYLHDLQSQQNIYMNDTGLKFLGYTREQIDALGCNFLKEVIHPEDLVNINPQTIKDLAQGKVHRSEYRLKNAQGEWRWHLKHTMVFKSSPEGISQQILGVVIDIHDRKQIELELQASQHFLKTIADTIPGIIYIYDVEKNQNIYINNSGLTILGYTRNQINQAGTNFLSQIVHQDDLPVILPIVMEQLAKGQVASSKYRVKNSQEEWKWVLDHTTNFQISDTGTIQKIVGIVIDIDDLKIAETALQQLNIELDQKVVDRTSELSQANILLSSEIEEKVRITEALKQQEEFFRAVFEQAAVGMNIATRDGKIVKVNQKMCEMLGYSEAELLTMTWMELTPPEFITRGIEFTEKRHRREIGDQQFEKQKIHKNGTRVWVNVSISLWKDPTTDILYDFVVTQNISDRKQMELALLESEARFQRMVANIPGMVYQFRCDPEGNYQFTYANYYTQELYEISPTELIEDVNLCMKLTHPEDVERLEQSIFDSFNTLQPWYWLGRIITPSGKLKWIEGNSRPEKQANGDVIWDGIVMDVTDRKATEDKIQTNLQEKELLLKEIHHRVKNNLQIISSLLTLQSHNVTEPKILALFQDSQTRIYAIALIHEKLYKTTEFEQINFTGYIENLVSYLHQLHSSPQKPIEIRTNIAEILLNIETAIPCGLIISELVINALKYAFPKPIARQLITIDLQRIANQQLALSIKDNGIGIPNDCNLEETSSLGLRLVKMLTQQLEGEITLTCNPGTHFTITFYELKYSQRV